jgi:radical SAM protein with 4Fe4S-binding SPASM domain
MSDPANLPSLDDPTLTQEEREYLAYRLDMREKSKHWDEFTSAMRTYTALNRIPYKGTFELTPQCSLQCKMCLVRLDACDMPAQGRLLTTDEWIRMGEMAFEAGTVDLLLTGGEPMLRPDFAKIYTALSDMGFLLRVYTNATLVTPEIEALFEERPPQGVEITVYGASPETYERVGGWADAYPRMVEGLDRIQKHVRSIKLKATIIRDNAADFAALQDFALQRGLPLSTTTLPIPAVRGAKADVRGCRLNLQELLDFHAKHPMALMNADCAPPTLDERSPVYCDAGLSSYAILWNGSMVACMTDDDPNCAKGRPLEEGFATAWDKIFAFREGKCLPKECLTCPVYAMCSTCAVHHHAETGAYDKHTIYGCDFFRIQQGLQVLPK